eukprot:1893533-Rhodomonas_salina.1
MKRSNDVGALRIRDVIGSGTVEHIGSGWGFRYRCESSTAREMRCEGRHDGDRAMSHRAVTRNKTSALDPGLGRRAGSKRVRSPYVDLEARVEDE